MAALLPATVCMTTAVELLISAVATVLVDLVDLDAGQLDERAARAGAFLAGNHGDGLIRVEIGAGGRGNAGQGKRGQRRDFGDFVHDVFSSFYTFFQ